MTEAPEPKDKLDAATTVAVSGPEDAAERWRQIDWRRAQADVRRLRQRIFTATKAGEDTHAECNGPALLPAYQPSGLA